MRRLEVSVVRKCKFKNVEFLFINLFGEVFSNQQLILGSIEDTIN